MVGLRPERLVPPYVSAHPTLLCAEFSHLARLRLIVQAQPDLPGLLPHGPRAEFLHLADPAVPRPPNSPPRWFATPPLLPDLLYFCNGFVEF